MPDIRAEVVDSAGPPSQTHTDIITVGSGSGTVASVTDNGHVVTVDNTDPTNPIVDSPSFGTSAGTIAQGNDSRFTDSRPPTGSAGGDLTGTYPNPTLASVLTAGGPTGSTTVVPVITWDAKGRLTAVTTATIDTKGGNELGYTELTSTPATFNGVGQANASDVSGLSVAVTVGTRAVKVIAHAGQCSNNTADDGVSIGIVESSTILSTSSGHSSAANRLTTLHAEARLTPSAGSHTYKVQAWVNTGGTGTLTASSTNPIFIQVIEL